MAKDGVNLPIITTFKGGGTKQAETALEHLGGVAKRIGGTLAVSFGAAALIGFGKASVSAFMAEDKAAKILGNTLGNLGLAFQSNSVNEWVDSLARATGVSKDEIRPAFDSIVRASGDVAQAQKLVALSMDIAAGSGKSVSAVALALTKTLGGNTTALGKMGLGISQATLKTKDAGKIIAELSSLYLGNAATAADTYAGKVNRIGIAWQDAKEKIGEGVIGAFNVSGGGGITGLTKAIDSFGQTVGDAIRGVGVLIAKLESVGGKDANKNKGVLGKRNKAQQFIVDYLAAGWHAIMDYTPLAQLSRVGKTDRLSTVTPAAAGPNAATGNRQIANVASRVAAENAAAAAASKAAAAKSAATAKAAADQKRLAKDAQILAKTTFSDDMKRLEIGAALKSDLSKKDRLELEIQLTKIELQQALSMQNVGLADQLAAKLSTLTTAQTALATQLATVPKVSDPFKDANTGATDLTDTLTRIRTIFGIDTQIPSPFKNALLDADLLLGKLASINSTPTLSAATGRGGSSGPNRDYGTNGGDTTVNLNVDGKTIATAVIPALVDNSASGGSTTSARRGSDEWLL